MTARDDVRSALITAGATGLMIDAGGYRELHECEQAIRDVLDALPRSLLLRFAWEGLSDEERAGYVATAREALANVARTWELSEDIAFALDAALMTGGEDDG